MTPFGDVLCRLRRSRHLKQRELAELLNVQPSYLSALENGKKGPPSDQVLGQLSLVLNLDDQEINDLESSVEQSQRVFRLPDNTTLDEFAFIYQLKKRLGSLSVEELAIMTNTLKLGTSLARRARV